MTLLYLTIWVALALLVLTEAGKSVRPGAAWTRAVSIGGALLAIVHALMAFGIRYRWDHDAAVVDTARQAEAVFGVGWRGSLYVNYVFLGVWLVIGWRSRHWLWRTFVLVMVVNGAVIFARPAARPLGVVLVIGLLWVWSRPRVRS